MPRKILFLVPYPLDESPSQRFRFEQYLKLLRHQDFQVDVQSFLDSRNWRYFFHSGNLGTKALAVFTGFAKRIRSVFVAPAYDFIFVHRESTPIGPPIFEWIYARILKKKIIYDFDDAIWLTDRKNESFFFRILKWRSKVRLICKWSYKVSCGNEYLCSFARQYNANVLKNPTTIDTETYHNPELYRRKEVRDKIVIGWTGSHSTLKYLLSIEATIQKIQSRFPSVHFLVIADRKPELNIKDLSFLPWSKESEIEDLLQMDIGIMPLPNDLWSQGKCGFKALQYMALSIPSVASPVGVNEKIIESGKNGILSDTPEEWQSALTTLIIDQDVRNKIGSAGRDTVIKNYSVLSNSSTFLSLFEMSTSASTKKGNIGIL